VAAQDGWLPKNINAPEPALNKADGQSGVTPYGDDKPRKASAPRYEAGAAGRVELSENRRLVVM